MIVMFVDLEKNYLGFFYKTKWTFFTFYKQKTRYDK